jgi:two-component system, OmpR family, sensor histidine kinase KdpD
MDLLLQAAVMEADCRASHCYALHVITPGPQGALLPRRAERLQRLLHQAECMGAQVIRLEASDPCMGIVNFVRSLRARHASSATVIMGCRLHHSLFPRLHSGLARRVDATLRGEALVRMISLPRLSHPLWGRLADNFFWGGHWRNLLAAPIAILATIGIDASLNQLLPRIDVLKDATHISVLFLLSCMLVTGRYGLLPGILASVLSFSVVGFFYIQPRQPLTATPSEFFTLVLFLVASLGVAVNIAYMLSFAHQAQQQEQRTNALYRISRMAFSALTLEESLHILHRELRQMLQYDVAYFLPDTVNLKQLVLMVPQGIQLTPDEQHALESCWQDSLPTGTWTAVMGQIDWRFEPMVTPRDRIGVLGVRLHHKRAFDPLLGRTLSLLAHQSAAVIERLELGHAMEQNRLQRERERLRSSLLSSVSHDLKTPLASIIGALSVYQTMKASLSPERQDILTQTALEEAQRLNSFISNIIDMARLESGEAGLHPEWLPPQDVILRVKRALRHRLKHHQLLLAPDFPAVEVWVDPAQTEQAIFSIIDNAIKYAPAETPIEVALYTTVGNSLTIAIRDHGPGIPEQDQQLIFDKYTRLKKEDSQVAGTGLGLAIAKAIIEQQQGTLTVHNHPEGGAVFTIGLAIVRAILTQPTEPHTTGPHTTGQAV